MKKFIYILIVCCLLVSCKKKVEVGESQESVLIDMTGISFSEQLNFSDESIMETEISSTEYTIDTDRLGKLIGVIDEEETTETTKTKETTKVKETTKMKEKSESEKSVDKLLSRLENELGSREFESIEVKEVNENIVEEEISTPSNIATKSETQIVGDLVLNNKPIKVIDIVPAAEVVMYKNMYPELFDYKYVETTKKETTARTQPTIRETTAKPLEKGTTKQTEAKATKVQSKTYQITIGSLKVQFRDITGYAITQPSSNALRYQSADTATVVDCISINPSGSTVYLRNAYKAAVNLYGEGIVVTEPVKNKDFENLKLYIFEQKRNGTTIKSVPIAAFAEVDNKHGLQINNTTGTEAGGVFINNLTKALTVQ